MPPLSTIRKSAETPPDQSPSVRSSEPASGPGPPTSFTTAESVSDVRSYRAPNVRASHFHGVHVSFA